MKREITWKSCWNRSWYHERATINRNSICADFTMGQGYDTPFQPRKLHSSYYAFDIQPQAAWRPEKSRKCNSWPGRENTTSDLDSHECCDIYIREPLDLGIFNFDICRIGDPEIMTRRKRLFARTTKSIASGWKHGILILVLYWDRPATGEESEHCWHECCVAKPLLPACRITMHNS